MSCLKENTNLARHNFRLDIVKKAITLKIIFYEIELFPLINVWNFAQA